MTGIKHILSIVLCLGGLAAQASMESITRSEMETVLAPYQEFLTPEEQRLQEQPLHIESDFSGPLSILQGLTDEESTQFTIVFPKRFKLELGLESSSLEKHSIEVLHKERIEQPFSDWAVLKVQLEGLRLGDKYHLQVFSQAGKLLDLREFEALDSRNPRAKFAAVSCAYDGFHVSGIWKSMIRQNPQVIFMIGDNVYADRLNWFSSEPADLRQLWRRYVETRRRIWFYRSKKLIPVLATWDDHDYGSNNENRNWVNKDKALKVFNTFYAQDPLKSSASFHSGPGVSFRWDAFDQHFIFLDGRTFKSPLDSKEDPGMLGQAQRQWLTQQFKTMTRPTWITSGMQFFGSYRGGNEAFQGEYPDQFQDFTAQLKAQEVPIYFMSGDVHYSEVMEIPEHFLGHPSLELTASSAHSFIVPGYHLRYSNPYRVRATSLFNFTLIKAWEGSNGLLRGKVKAFGAWDNIIFQYNF